MDRRTAESLDRYLTTPPEAPDPALVYCNTEDCPGVDGLVADCLAWTETTKIELMVWEDEEGRVEDDLCADALQELLAGREPDLAAFAAAIRADPRVRCV